MKIVLSLKLKDLYPIDSKSLVLSRRISFNQIKNNHIFNQNIFLVVQYSSNLQNHLEKSLKYCCKMLIKFKSINLMAFRVKYSHKEITKR